MTANLTVRYRQPTPLHRELKYVGVLVGVSGRKVKTQGELWAGDTMTAEAQGLFVRVGMAKFVELMEARQTAAAATRSGQQLAGQGERRGAADQRSADGEKIDVSWSSHRSQGSGRAADPAPASGLGRLGETVPALPPRPRYMMRPETGSGTVSRAACTAGNSRNRSQAASSAKASSRTTPQV